MAVSANKVRELVAQLAGAHEGTHHGHPDFRIEKRIFATLSEKEDRVALRLTAIEARALAHDQPEGFRLVSDREPFAWVSAPLDAIDEDALSDLLEEAWRHVASPPAGRGRTKGG
jgi:hypothetical protein